MPARSGSSPASLKSMILSASVFHGGAPKIAPYDPAIVCGKRRPLDRLLLAAPPIATCVRGRRCNIRNRCVGRNLDPDAAAVATLAVGEQHLLGGDDIGRLHGVA